VVWESAVSWNRIWCILAWKSDIWGHQFFILPDFSKKILSHDHSNSLTFSSHPWPVETLERNTETDIQIHTQMLSDAIQAFVLLPGLLQLAVLRHHRRSDESAAVCSECGCMFCVRRSTLWPHNAGATGAALASGSATDGFQHGHPGLPVTVQHGPSLPIWPPVLRLQCTAANCQIKLSYLLTKHIYRQVTKHQNNEAH